MTYILNEAQEAWLKALESGEFKQTQGEMFNRHENAFCCLGVACEILGHPKDDLCRFVDADGVAPPNVAEALRLRTRRGLFEIDMQVGDVSAHSLVHANDSSATFSEIAAFIRSNPTAVFKE